MATKPVAPTQPVAPVSCPNCGAQFNVQLQSIINGQNPSQKAALLQGRINMVQCPQCGQIAPLNAPVLYYDLEKELAFVFVPNGLQMTPAEQEKIVGGLTKNLMNTLPQEQHRFYLFNPKPFLVLENMIKAILEKDGITEEMYEAQKAKVQLLETLLKMEDEAAIKAKVKENDHLLDREFFEILTASMQAAQYEGNTSGAQALFGLRAFLAAESSQGTQAVAEIDEQLGIVYLKNQEDLLEKLQNAKDEAEFEGWTAAGHQMLDYQFFQYLTAKIDAAAKAGQKKEEQRLKALRTKILETKGRQEEESRVTFQKSADLLKAILQSDDPPQMIESRLEELDETFFAILSANIQEARRQKQDKMAEAMEMVGNMAMALLHQRHGGQTETPPPTEEPASPPPKIHLP